MDPQHLFLVVDDVPVVRQLLVRAVRNACPSALAVPVGSVKEARQQLQQLTFTALITDYHLHDGDGLQVLGAALQHNAEIRALVISADDHLGNAAIAAGARAFLSKPFEMATLLAVIRSLCG